MIPKEQRKKRSFTETRQRSWPGEKYCKIHNSNSHFTSECYKNNGPKKNEKQTKKAYAIKELLTVQGALEFKSHTVDKKSPVQLTLDTELKNATSPDVWLTRTAGD